MEKKHSLWSSRLGMTCVMILAAWMAMAESVSVTTPGTLSTLLPSSATEAVIEGPINGTDVKYMRQLVNEGGLSSLNLKDADIVGGGDAYLDDYYTEDDVLGEKMFFECANLKSIVLPLSLSRINKEACAHSGLTSVVIPDNVTQVGMDAFAYCEDLTSVTIGLEVAVLEQGVFYQSNVKDAYMKALIPPLYSAYEFSSDPTIHVYDSSSSLYKASSWSEYGSLVDDLDETYGFIFSDDRVLAVKFQYFFADYACTQLYTRFATLDDDALRDAMSSVGLTEPLVNIAIKVKNDQWEPYEKQFRIHDYSPYSDAKYWHKELISNEGSYMGNPTGIYMEEPDTFYVFADRALPSDATIYFSGVKNGSLISNPTSGTYLNPGLNIIVGKKNSMYYVVYTAYTTKEMTKKVSEWPDVKVHIEGGIVDGYYDASHHSDEEYQALLKNATFQTFTVKGKYTAMNFNTDTYRNTWPISIDRSVARFDSLILWERELMGITEFVANGLCAHAPYCLAGGDAYFPNYYNNIHWAIEGDENQAGLANSTTYRTSYNSPSCVNNSFNVDSPDLDEWCVAHEVGHALQDAINLEGGSEVSNNLFSNVICFLDGRKVSSGGSVSTAFVDFANHVPYAQRDVYDATRMYYQLYLYYHQAQHDITFYPRLFQELRKDPLTLWSNTDESMLKFVRKVCEVANEDLTDFFRVWGFFEPIDTLIDDYGYKHITVTQEQIDATLEEISKYPTKNREIIFIEDRITNLPTTDFLTTAGNDRLDPDYAVGKCGTFGQYTEFSPEASQVPDLTAVHQDSFFVISGTDAVGVVLLDDENNLLYGSNDYKFCVPSEVMEKNYHLYAVSSNGQLYNVPTTSTISNVEVRLDEPGTVSQYVKSSTFRACISGPINGTDIKYLLKMIDEGSLVLLDLSNATIVSGGESYDGTHFTTDNCIGEEMFSYCTRLSSIVLPNSITKIDDRAFAHSCISQITIPANVTSVGFDAFAYCKSLRKVTILGDNVNLRQGVFYQSNVKNAYVESLTPLNHAMYMFSTEPTIHVHSSALQDYLNSDWPEFGTIVGDLDAPVNPDLTGVQEVGSDALAVKKIIRDNRVIIVRGGEEWTVLGLKIK